MVFLGPAGLQAVAVVRPVCSLLLKLAPGLAISLRGWGAVWRWGLSHREGARTGSEWIIQDVLFTGAGSRERMDTPFSNRVLDDILIFFHCIAALSPLPCRG